MLFTDGVLVLASWMIASYWKKGSGYSRIYSLFIFFTVMTWVSLALAISDTFVIHRISVWWATLPIIRGLTFRLPLALVEIWILLRIYGFLKS